MRWMVILVMVGLVGFMASGCMSAADIQRLDAELQKAKAQYEALMKRMEALNSDKDKLLEAIKSGALPLSEGMALIKNLEATKDELLLSAQNWKNNIEEIKRMKESAGYSWLDIIGGIVAVTLGGGGAGTVLTRILRGPSSKPYKNPDGSIKVSG